MPVEPMQHLRAIVIEAGNLRDFVAQIFESDGAPSAEAQLIAEHLCGANLAGHESHGVIRVPLYLSWRRDGLVGYGRYPKADKDLGAIVSLDGGFGFGQVVGVHAVREGVERARLHGMSLVLLHSSGHLGRLGGWAEMAAEQNVASLHFLNSPGRTGIQVAPAGAREARLAPNPLAIGIPQADRDPLVLDITASAIPEGKVKAALNAGNSLPENAAIDARGNVIRDPKAYYGPPKGALLPAAGHKGAGLCFMIDLLAGALTGGGTSSPRLSSSGNNLLSVYIDLNKLGNCEQVKRSAAELAQWVRSAAPMKPGDRVMAPGDREAEMKARRLANGVPLDEETWRQLTACADALRVPIPTVH